MISSVKELVFNQVELILPQILMFQVMFQRVEVENVEMHMNVNSLYLECDPGLRSSIWSYPVDIRDNVRRSYSKMGPCQPRLRKHSPIYYKG